MKNLNKKLLRRVGMALFTMTLNLTQACYATQAEQVILSRSTEDHLGTSIGRVYTAGTYVSPADKTSVYSSDAWPINVPIVHPYNPTDDMREESPNPPWFTLTAQLLAIDIKNIPSPQAQNMLTQLGITQAERFIVLQNNPWKTGINILFRPQPWLHPKAKNTASDESYASDITAYYAPIARSFTAVEGGAVSTHGAQKVFSGNSHSIGSLDFNITNGFYTICIDRSSTPPHAAITLHVLYNDTEHGRIKSMIEGLGVDQLSLEEFFNNLDRIEIDTTTLRSFTEGTINVTPN